MTRNMNYKETLFKRANLTPIHGEPTFKTPQKLQNEKKQTPSPSNQILEEEHMATLE